MHRNQANAFNIVSQFNHIWNTMQGITSDGGALYYGVGGADGTGLGNKMLNNLVHDTTDSSIIDGNMIYPAYGYGGHGLYVDNQSGGVDVENNVVYRVSKSTLWQTNGVAAGGNCEYDQQQYSGLRAPGRVQSGFAVEARLLRRDQSHGQHHQ